MVQVSPARYRTITVAALLALIGLVITGVAVRLTDSGLGCDDWPTCNDERLVDVSSKHAAIEQVNRLLTGIVSVAIIAAVLGAHVRVPRRRDLTMLSLGLVAGLVGQIVLGGITVRVDLHPLAVQAHLLLAMVLVANAVVLVDRAGDPDGVERRRCVTSASQQLAWGLATATAAAIVTGTVVTGAGPHAGDEEAPRFDVAISAVARIHSITVILALLVGLALAMRISRERQDRAALQGPLGSWLFVGLLQAAVGYTQYFSDVPALLVGVHVTAATVLWAVTVNLLLATAAVVPDRHRARGDVQRLVTSPTA